MADGFTSLTSAVDYGQIAQNTDVTSYETHKRSLEVDSDDHGDTKRANFSGKSPMLKTMVPNNIAGSIIGKKGQTIAVMQEQTGAKIKLSANHEFYPGTAERVVIIVGELHQILSMLDLITEKIRIEYPGRTHSFSSSSEIPERCKQIKLIVPNSTAGMIIGKGGAFIRGITEETGAKVQISQKSGEITGERVITISGEPEQMKAASAVVVTKCQDDPDHGLNTNLSYSGYTAAKPALQNGGKGGGGGGDLGLGALGNLSSVLGLTGGGRNAASATSNLLAQANLLASNQLASATNPLASANPLTSMLGVQQLGGNPSAAGITTIATYEMSVPDPFVGVILGRAGKALGEIMQFSNANISISHKGEFITGTSNRKVVITGDPTSVQMAYFLITQKILQEVSK